MLILERVSLKKFTTFKIGGEAKFFTIVNNLKELEQIINFLENNKIKFFILGGGSNILFSDKGFDGLIIKPKFETFNFLENGEVIIGSSRLMPEIVYEACRLGYQGLEWAGGLPGELGGAIRGNAGCFGSEIKDIIKEVLSVNLLNKEIRIFKKEECQFSYRSSFFKFNKEWLIIEAKINLKTNNESNILLKIMNEKIEYRKNRHPVEFPNAGSIFKNIPIDSASPDLIEIAKKKNVIKGDKIPTAFIIEYLGLKGKEIGGAKISEKHANYIINFNNASSQDVLDLIDLVKDEVQKKFNLKLIEEIEIVN
ncbi:MAG: UDP-N-acetylenolpyruvoylglucosamine reductase [Candidatus Parcubacteria bacterium]|nr:MAG: UDP-N-acetylenolpyruvoylglucosamine reductase [Candidatus Parcubacteria bacterium]